LRSVASGSSDPELGTEVLSTALARCCPRKSDFARGALMGLAVWRPG
jgi:hypothetical protein